MTHELPGYDDWKTTPPDEVEIRCRECGELAGPKYECLPDETEMYVCPACEEDG